jgi:hypothetical protein
VKVGPTMPLGFDGGELCGAEGGVQRS